MSFLRNLGTAVRGIANERIVDDDSVRLPPPPDDRILPPRRDPFFTQAGIYSLPFPRRELIAPRPTPTDPRGLMSQLNALYDRTITPYITPKEEEEETPPPDDGGGTPPDDGGGTGGGGGGTGGGGTPPPDGPPRIPPGDRIPPQDRRFPPIDFPPIRPPIRPPILPPDFPPSLPPMVPPPSILPVIPPSMPPVMPPSMPPSMPPVDVVLPPVAPPSMPPMLPPMDMITPPTPPIQVPPRDDMIFAGGSPTFDERGPVFDIEDIRNLIELDDEPEMTESPMMMSGISQLLPTLPDPTISEMDRIMEDFDRFSPSRLGMGMGRVS